MVALKIDEIKPFTAKLFLGEIFDHFLVREVNIVTFNSFTIDGHIRTGYYSTQELDENPLEELSLWKVLKPVCFSLIKGKKLPGSFRIVLQLAPEGVEAFLKRRQVPLTVDHIQGLCLNLRYEEGKLFCVTGTSVSLFTLDKSLDREWDEEVRLFLKTHEIIFLEE